MARQVMNAEEIRRALTRISHEIIEKEGTEGLVVVGIQRRGVPLAKVIAIEADVEGARLNRDAFVLLDRVNNHLG